MLHSIHLFSSDRYWLEHLQMVLTGSMPELRRHCHQDLSVLQALRQCPDNHIVVVDCSTLATVDLTQFKTCAWQWLAVCDSDGDEVQIQMLLDGYAGVVAKSMPLDRYPRVLRGLIKSEIWFSRQVTAFAIRRYQQSTPSSPETMLFMLSQMDLTKRQKQLVQQILQGKSNQEIADTLFISVHTVKSHVSQLLAKFGVESRQGLIKELLQYETH
ncbi:helix-turn-helix transcriptional regulator [Ferrimonas senticii]|uniref:helix-turn-helix transcriptional regulator n=1 Tax=Ferrimonas senticii TaxID=394566 RepID=UPI0004141EC2|nr:LuxR C-terminal-related transcriptional regulator [Ferrimonas senticii]